LAQKIKKTLEPRKKAKALKTTAKTAKKPGRKSVSGRTTGKSTAALKKPAAKERNTAVKTGKQKTSKSKKRTVKEKKNMEVELKKASLSGKKGSGTNISQGLLRQTKTTSAALTHLGKGIEFIYKKDYKKARNELTTLVRSFPDETEILARARSYLQICDREEQSQKKPEFAQDQLYTLGVLEHNKANCDAAISYFQQSLKKHPDADYIYYSVAASLARKGDLQASMEHLKKAIELNEDSRIFARNDEDFSVFDTDEKLSELLGISPNPANEPQ
jgi:tetratricopeptide (TPR) repeat protein